MIRADMVMHDPYSSEIRDQVDWAGKKRAGDELIRLGQLEVFLEEKL